MCCFSKWTRKSLGFLTRASWIPLSLASTLFFLVNRFPNISTFHCLTFLVKLVIANDRGWTWSQLSLTNLGNPGWRSHIDWNLKGLFFAVVGGLLSLIRTRQWSEKTLVKWVTKASEYKSLQEGFAKHLSILSKIKSVICLRLDHVYFGPEKPNSKKLQQSRQSLNSKALLRFIFLLPYLSSPLRTLLKSPRSN